MVLHESRVPLYRIRRNVAASIFSVVAAVGMGHSFGLDLASNLEERTQLVATDTAESDLKAERLQQLNRSIFIETIGLGICATLLGNEALGVPLKRKRMKNLLATPEGHKRLAEALPHLEDKNADIAKKLYTEDNPMFMGRLLRDSREAEHMRLFVASDYKRFIQKAGMLPPDKDTPKSEEAKTIGLLDVTVGLLNHSKNIDTYKEELPDSYERSKQAYELELGLLDAFAPLASGETDEPQTWGGFIQELRQDKPRAQMLRQAHFAIFEGQRQA